MNKINKMDREQKTIDASIAYFNSGFGCAEAVLKAVAEHIGVESDLIPRLATGFCGGMARTGGMCGAVTGGVLALNLLYGRSDADGDKEANYSAIQEFLRIFRERFNDVNCPGLTGVDLGTDEGQQAYKEKDLHPRCANFVGEATRMVLETI
jgi:C_GCAxxG_C_C family probable redox protein